MRFSLQFYSIDIIFLNRYCKNYSFIQLILLEAMKFKAALFYQGCIAFYSVYLLHDNYYKAKLDEYSGQAAPPQLVQLSKDGFSWTSDCPEKEVVKELAAAIEQRSAA